MNPDVHPSSVDPVAMGLIAILALVINVVVLAIILKRSR